MPPATTAAGTTAPVRRRRRRLNLTWVGIVPFGLFVLLFLILPTMKIVIGAFQRPDGSLTFSNVASLFTPSILSAFWISIRISVASALLGCLIGFAVAAALVLGGLPARIRSLLLTFSGVASGPTGDLQCTPCRFLLEAEFKSSS